MKIKTFHAHFLMPTVEYGNERVGFSVHLDEGEQPEDVLEELRERAIKMIGKKASKLYEEKRDLEREIYRLGEQSKILRKEWEATAHFLRTQGLNPDAPSMPQFKKLLTSVEVEAETVVDEGDYEEEDHEEDIEV